MTKYKLIVSDFDGTLAGKGEVISQKVIDAIKRWEGSGMHFSIATGKSYLRIKKDIAILGLKTPQITRGGAEIVDSGGKIIDTKIIDKDTVEDLINFLLKNHYEIIVDTEDKYYSTNNYQSRNPLIEHFLTLDQFEMRAVPKVVVWINDKNFEEAEVFLEKILIKRYPQLHIVRSYGPEGKAWDITSLQATKHLAALELMKILDIKREETIGVGDGYNDFSLLEACGYKVAMANAPEDLKAIADLVVPSYQEDGVAVLIEKLLANEKGN